MLPTFDQDPMIARTTQAVGMGILAAAGQLAGDFLGEKTHIELGTAVAIAASMGTMVWWLSSKLTKINDRMDTVDRLQDELSALREKVDELPCKTVIACDPPPKHRKL